ncbi:MAG: tetratricopeptide repeat protein, partial [Bryobacteraceae bacterium]
SAVTHQNRGIVLKQMNRPAEGIAAFEKAVALGLQPAAQVDALFQIGRIHHDQNEPDAELAAYQRALQVDPYHYLVRKNLAFVYLKQQKWQDAEREFTALAQYNKTDEDVIRSLRFLANRR